MELSLRLGYRRINLPHCYPKAWEVSSTRMQIGNRGWLRGTKNVNAKCTPLIVKAIRVSTESQRVLAARYHLAQSTVWMIRNNRTWRQHA